MLEAGAKDKLTKAEISRLKKLFIGADANKLSMSKSLIETAAFLSVSLLELQDEINEQGYTDGYKNGENQFGTKQNEYVKTHIAMTKNLTTIIKNLSDMLPTAIRKESKLDALRRGE